MAIPEPTINIDDLLVGSSNPALDVGVREGSMIGLIERPQIASPYGPDNLPEFMKGFEQVTPTTFAPVIGGLTTAGLTPEEILLQQQREQEFRESFAIDPTMYGAQYQPALFSVLDKPLEAPAPEDDGLVDLLATYAAVEDFLPDMGMPDVEPEAPKIDLGDVSIDVPEIEVNVPSIAAEFPSLDLPSIDAPSIDVPSLDVPSIDVPKLEKPLVDIDFPDLNVPSLNADFPELDVSSMEINFPDIETPDIKDLLPDFNIDLGDAPKSGGFSLSKFLPEINLPDIPDALKDSGQIAAEIVNLVEDPGVADAFDVVDKIEKASLDAGREASVLPPAAAGAMLDASAVASIVDAFENPNVGNLADAYSGVNYIADNYIGQGLGDSAYFAETLGTIAGGINALEDGKIDSISEAVAVADAANTAYQIGSSISAGSSASAATTAAATTTAPAGSFAAAIPQIATFAAITSLMPAVSKALKGGAAGNYPRIQGDFNVENGQFTSSEIRASDTNRAVGDVFAKETADTATSMANDLINNYGFEIDYKALQAAPEVMRLQTSSHYAGEGRSQEGAAAGSSDFVAKLLQNGILKPTENTPTEILSSNDAFGNFLTDYFATNQDAYAARMYDKTDGTGEEMISVSGGGNNRTRNVTSRARFATEAAAQDWASNNSKEDYNMESVRVGKAAKRKMPHKTTTSYEVVPIQVGDQTVYELKKSSSTVKVSQSEYDEATKPKPEPVAQPTPTYDPSDFLSNFNFNFGSFPVGPLF
jgi:hypothetical protein